MKKITTIIMAVIILIINNTLGNLLTATALENDDSTNFNYDNLNSYIENEFEKSHMPAMSLEIINADEVLLSGTYGACESLDSSFILGSLSKSFTAVAVMQLAEKGEIDLNQTVRTYLQNFDSNSKTTVKQLLNQTSGISTYATLENYESSDTATNFEYSNVNYNLLGMIIEKVSGIDYGSYIKANIFQPLNMEHSYVSLAEAKANGLIEGNRNYFGFMIKEEMEYPDDISGWLALPSAYIISSTSDMGKYLSFYLNKGKDVLSEESINKIFNDSVFAYEGYNYGMGWGIDNTSDETIYLHGGLVENYTTNMYIIPERGLAVITMFNANDYFVSNNISIKISNNIVNKLTGKQTVDIKASEYWTSHLLINLIMLVLLFLCILPILLIKKWNKKNKNETKIKNILLAFIVHLIFPIFLLMFFEIIGIPMAVVKGFAPDVFIVIIVGSIMLFAAGIYKFTILILNK